MEYPPYIGVNSKLPSNSRPKSKFAQVAPEDLPWIAPEISNQQLKPDLKPSYLTI